MFADTPGTRTFPSLLNTRRLPSGDQSCLAATLNSKGVTWTTLLPSRSEVNRAAPTGCPFSATKLSFQSLNKAVNRLREALGDSAESPHFIETLPRKGYRFIGVVRNDAGIGTANAVTSDEPEAGPSSQGHTGEKAEEPRALSFAFRYALAVAIPCLIGALILIPKWFLRHATPDLANVRINKVTDSGGTTGVAISHDGRYIVYSLRRGKGESLRLRQISTRSEVEILPVGPGFHGLTFSRNGDYIYFTRSDPNNSRFKYLYSVPLLGGPVRQMIADVDSPVAFSPNGQQFVFERALPRRNLIELRIANTDGSAEHAIATIPNGDAGLFQPGPAWSRDGRTIVCPFRILGREIRWILAAVSVPDGRVREIYSDTAPSSRPAWLSGRSLLIPRYDAAYDRWQLWTFSYPDGNPQRFTNDLANYDMPLDVTSDGKIIAAMASTVVSNIWESSADNPSLQGRSLLGNCPCSMLRRPLVVAYWPQGTARLGWLSLTGRAKSSLTYTMSGGLGHVVLWCYLHRLKTTW